jgi:hypothetical protein
VINKSFLHEINLQFGGPRTIGDRTVTLLAGPIGLVCRELEIDNHVANYAAATARVGDEANALEAPQRLFDDRVKEAARCSPGRRRTAKQPEGSMATTMVKLPESFIVGEICDKW